MYAGGVNSQAIAAAQAIMENSLPNESVNSLRQPPLMTELVRNGAPPLSDDPGVSQRFDARRQRSIIVDLAVWQNFTQRIDLLITKLNVH